MTVDDDPQPVPSQAKLDRFRRGEPDDDGDAEKIVEIADEVGKGRDAEARAMEAESAPGSYTTRELKKKKRP